MIELNYLILMIMKQIFTFGMAAALLMMTALGLNAQDAQNPWHLIAFENAKEVAFYNVEKVAGIEVTEKSVTVSLDNGKKISHPVAVTSFGFEPRKAGDGTANENINTSRLHVFYANGKLHFSEKVHGIAVYSVTGALVAQFAGELEEAPVYLEAGFYFIQSGKKSAKLPVFNGYGSAVAQAEVETPIRLRSNKAIKIYLNITTGSLNKSVPISVVDKLSFTAGNCIVYTRKLGNPVELADYQGVDFSVAPVHEGAEPLPAEPIDLTVEQAKKVDADNHFAFDMFRLVSKEEGANTFFSPLSLNLALGMLYNGATGDTRTEMAQVMGMTDFTEREINEYYQKISQTLMGIDPQTELGIANSIWHRHTLPVKQSFIDINKKYFDAKVKGLDFFDPAAADSINNWCAEKTRDKITEIVEKPLPGAAIMYLINALYFKSKWAYQFDKEKTYQRDFTVAGNKTVKVNMMSQQEKLPYYADQYLQCVEMPYGNDAFSMVAILPAIGSDIEQLIANLDNEKWQNIIQKLTIQRDVIVELPRFKIECTIPLRERVKDIGLRRIFFGGLENISGGDLFVSDIKQKTYIEVNEEGTEAAAVTVISIVDISTGMKSFIADRPFLYLIKEKSTGLILFIGRMDEPVE